MSAETSSSSTLDASSPESSTVAESVVRSEAAHGSCVGEMLPFGQ